MKEIELQPRTEEISTYSKESKLLSNNAQSTSNSAKFGNVTTGVPTKISLKTIIIISMSVALVAITATLIGVFATKSSDEEKDETTNTETVYTKEEFYSYRTKSYLNLINKL